MTKAIWLSIGICPCYYPNYKLSQSLEILPDQNLSHHPNNALYLCRIQPLWAMCRGESSSGNGSNVGTLTLNFGSVAGTLSASQWLNPDFSDATRLQVPHQIPGPSRPSPLTKPAFMLQLIRETCNLSSFLLWILILILGIWAYAWSIP